MHYQTSWASLLTLGEVNSKDANCRCWWRTELDLWPLMVVLMLWAKGLLSHSPYSVWHPVPPFHPSVYTRICIPHISTQIGSLPGTSGAQRWRRRTHPDKSSSVVCSLDQVSLLGIWASVWREGEIKFMWIRLGEASIWATRCHILQHRA